MQNTAAQNKTGHPIYQNLFLESGENRSGMHAEGKTWHHIYQNMCPVMQLTSVRFLSDPTGWDWIALDWIHWVGLACIGLAPSV